MDDDMEKSEGDRINILHDFIKAKLNQTPGNLALSDEKAIFAEAERLEIVNKVNMINFLDYESFLILEKY